MKVLFDRQFSRDLDRLHDRRIRTRVVNIIERLESAQALTDLPNVKRLEGAANAYRIRVGEYRIGLLTEKDGITLVRCLPRGDIYRKFP